MGYLPKLATVQQACDWLTQETGEAWVLQRLLEAELMPWFWLDYSPDWPVIFGDKIEGYLAPMVFVGDTRRLEADGADALVNMTRTHNGELFKLTPAMRVPLSDLRFKREDLERTADAFPKQQSKLPESRPSVRTLFHAEIADRDFGSRLLQVGALQAWAQAKGYPLDTQPPLADFDFVQVEALLCAIERAATQGMTYDQAELIVQADPELSKGRAADCAPIWVIGAHAHQKWRNLIADATTQGELQLLDFGSKLPVRQAGGATPEPVQRRVLASNIQDEAILNALRAAGYDPLKLPKNPDGKSGVKAEIRDALVGKHHAFPKLGTQFKKAWERLTERKEIVIF